LGADKGFTKTIANLLTQTFPDRFTAKLKKASYAGSSMGILGI
jgi:DNA primase